MGRAVEQNLVRALHEHVFFAVQTGGQRYVGVFHRRRQGGYGNGIGMPGHVRAGPERGTAVEKLDVRGVGRRGVPAHGFAVHVAVERRAAVQGRGMHGHAQCEVAVDQGFLVLRQGIGNHGNAFVGRGDAGRGIDLIGAGDGFLRVHIAHADLGVHGLHGCRFHQQAVQFAVGLFNPDQAVGQGRGRAVHVAGQAAEHQRLAVGHGHMPGNVRHIDRLVGAGRVELFQRGVRAQPQVVVAVADHILAGARACAFGPDGLLQFPDVVNGAQRRAVGVHLVKIVRALAGKMPVPVNQARQHDMPLQIHFSGRVKIALGPGLGLAAHKDDLAVFGGHHFRDFGLVRAQALEFAEIRRAAVIQHVRHGVNLAPIIHAVRIGRR